MDLKIEDYLLKREKLKKDLENQIELLKKMPKSVKVCGYDLDKESPYFCSDDYPLATDFRIEKRSERIEGFSSPDGGYSTYLYETYPQFYFKVGKEDLAIRVDIRHTGYDNDKRIVIKSVTQTHGCKDYSDENRRTENFIDLKKVFEFFIKKGVKETLIQKLNARVKEAEEF